MASVHSVVVNGASYDFEDKNGKMIAKGYDPTKPYAVGGYAVYEGKLYCCKTEITSGEAWNSAHWDEVTVGAEVAGLKGDMSEIKPVVNANAVEIAELKRDVDQLSSIYNYYDQKATYVQTNKVGADRTGYMINPDGSITSIRSMGQYGQLFLVDNNKTIGPGKYVISGKVTLTAEAPTGNQMTVAIGRAVNYINVRMTTTRDGDTAISVGEKVGWFRASFELSAEEAFAFECIPAAISMVDGTYPCTIENLMIFAGSILPEYSPNTSTANDKIARQDIVGLKNGMSVLEDAITYSEDITADFVSGGYYVLNGGVGSTAPDVTTAFATYSSLRIPCRKGDALTITCSGGDGGRAWAITDAAKKILSVAGANVVVSGMTLHAEEDGYFYVNNANSLQPNKSAVFSYSQIEKIKAAVDTEVNVLDRFITGKYYKLNGGVGTTVPEAPLSHASYSTLKMPCYAGDTLTITCSGGDGGRAWAITDRNNVILSVAPADTSVSNKVLTAEVDGYFYVNNSSTLQPNKSAVLGTTVGNYAKTISTDVDNVEDRVDVIENVIEAKPLKGKKWNVMGDSITANPDYAPQGGRYYELISTRQDGMVTRNYGIGGTKIGGTDENAFCNRYASMDSDADIVTVYGGVNDYQHPTDPTPLGQYGDSTNATFYGALKILLEGLITRYPYALIVFMTPIQPIRENRPTEANALGFTIDDYADAIIKMCGRYGVPVVDLCHTCGFTSRIEAEKTRYFYDGLHLNNHGHNKISYLLEEAMINNARGKIVDIIA